MNRRISMTAWAVIFSVSPTVALACDLDGMPGYHRYNPFANVPGFSKAVATPAETPKSAEASATDKLKPSSEARGEDPKSVPKIERANIIVLPQSPLDFEREWGNSSTAPEGLTDNI